MIGPFSALAAFPGGELIDLAGSFVLEPLVRYQQVTLELDLVLLPGHPKYASPSAEEAGCFRRATLRFDGVTQMSWSRQVDALPATDAADEPDYGSLASFVHDAEGYRVEGDLGVLRIVTAEAPSLELSETTSS